MNFHELQNLAREAVDLTGAAPPALLEEDSPGLIEDALDDEGGGDLYLVGIIGGKDVGKSALVNALVGKEITPRTSHGPGTESVIAYAHESRVDELRAILDAEAPGQSRIVTHREPTLMRQALLDLPDIDSHYEAHIELTRRMLRRMLFPIWVQSVEKYADHKPQALLLRVAEGNAPQNFVFCLNKIDQLSKEERESAAAELRRDYGMRLARRLELETPPRVWLISAISPDQYDLPELRRMVMSQKSEQSVAISRDLAVRRRQATLVGWLERQGIEELLARLDRMRDEVGEELAGRLTDPLTRQVIPELWADPAHRLRLGDEAFNERVRRWPIVRGLHQALTPLARLARMRLPSARRETFEGAAGLVAEKLFIDGRPLTEQVQRAFGAIRAANPVVGRLYETQRLWEEDVARAAAEQLRGRLAATVERQRAAVRMKAVRAGGPVSAVGRIALTVGALIWFPFLQPLIESMFVGGGGLIPALIHILSVNYLLEHAALIGLYFSLLWVALRWDTQRRVDKWINSWISRESADPELSLTAQTLSWVRELLAPVDETRRRGAQLRDRIAALKREPDEPGQAANDGARRA